MGGKLKFFDMTLQKFCIQHLKKVIVTTLNSTGLDVSEVPFPSVIICLDGMDLISSYSGMIKLAMEELPKKSKKLSLVPLKLASLLPKKIRVSMFYPLKF